jgi:hypothetical protein
MELLSIMTAISCVMQNWNQRIDTMIVLPALDMREIWYAAE